MLNLRHWYSQIVFSNSISYHSIFILFSNAMLFLTAYILALVTLLVTPVVSAPINVQRSLGIVASYPVHVDFEKRSSIFRTLPHHRRNLDTIPERNVIGYSSLITRDEATTLNVRSSGDVVEPELAKRAEGQIVRLVRRKSIFTKIKEGFQVTTFLSSPDMG